MNAFFKNTKDIPFFVDLGTSCDKKPFADALHPVRMIEKRSHGNRSVVHVMEVRVYVCSGGSCMESIRCDEKYAQICVAVEVEASSEMMVLYLMWPLRPKPLTTKTHSHPP
jgi:hypothetical protein